MGRELFLLLVEAEKEENSKMEVSVGYADLWRDPQDVEALRVGAPM